LFSANSSYQVDVEHLGDVTVVRFPGGALRLDDAHVPAVAQQLFRLVDEAGRCKLILNFHNVTFLATTGLGLLITLCKKLQAVGGRCILCNVDPRVYQVFEVTRLKTILEIRSDQVRKGDSPEKGV
jgi:anti-anti-sigma factor